MDLDEATAQYWEVMRAYNEQEQCQVVSTERALDMLNEVLTVTGPHHPLAVKVIKLRQDIITGD
jgi:hypothetical protein